MSTNLPTRAQIEQADPLEFAPAPRQERNRRVEFVLRG